MTPRSSWDRHSARSIGLSCSIFARTRSRFLIASPGLGMNLSTIFATKISANRWVAGRFLTGFPSTWRILISAVLALIRLTSPITTSPASISRIGSVFWTTNRIPSSRFSVPTTVATTPCSDSVTPRPRLSSSFFATAVPGTTNDPTFAGEVISLHAPIAYRSPLGDRSNNPPTGVPHLKPPPIISCV